MSTGFFAPPEGLQWGGFRNARGAQVRTAFLPGEGKGALVILTGFRESIEKYFPVARDLRDTGYDIHFMDWPGQGGSERFLPRKAHTHPYAGQVETLCRFVEGIRGARPLVALAHSMGGHIALRAMAAHPGLFDAALLTAPMIDIRTFPLPRPLANTLAQWAYAAGCLDSYVPGGKDWTPHREQFAKNTRTSDAEKFAALQRLEEDTPALQIGDATFGWVYHTLKSIAALGAPGCLESVHAPVLMQVSGRDKVVDNKVLFRAAARLPACRRVDIPRAKHEIWMERDDIRAPWLAAARDFLAQRKDMAP